jgi:TPP-dependent pyruvate/acetoin dehydrogenase alpha subunit
LVDLLPLRDAMKEQESESEPEWAEYNPSAAFEEGQADEQRDEELANMRSEMDEAHREAVEAAQKSEPPKTVIAYRDVYGEFPEGWPPAFED